MSSEVRQVVVELNEVLFGSEYYEHDYFQYLELVETPIGDYVKYMGCYLWDSENDYREWINDNEQISIRDHLIQEMGKLQEVVQNTLKVLKGE